MRSIHAATCRPRRGMSERHFRHSCHGRKVLNRKIDRTFVRNIGSDRNDSTIVSAVIAMGRALGQRVIAEGVETQEQLAFLRTRRCDEGQGFHFSHPLSAEDFRRLLVTGNDEPSERRPG